MTEQEWRYIFSDNLYRMLAYRKLTQLKFSCLIEVSQESVSGYLNCTKTPRVSTLLKMC